MEALSTTISSERFSQLFNRLLAATVPSGADASLLRAKLQVYFEALRSRPEWAISGAATQLIETEKFFPSVSQWVDACNTAVENRLRESLNAPRPWKLHCDTCRDTGWREHLCKPGQRCGRNFCARHDEAKIPYEHEYVSPCPCRDHNPSYQRETEYSRAQAMLRNKGEKKYRAHNSE